MTQINAHLMEKNIATNCSQVVTCFSWLNKETLWPLRYLETFFSQITKSQKPLAELKRSQYPKENFKSWSKIWKIPMKNDENVTWRNFSPNLVSFV